MVIYGPTFRGWCAWGNLLAEQVGVLWGGCGRAVRGRSGDVSKEWFVSSLLDTVLDELHCLITHTISEVVFSVVVTMFLLHTLV